MRRVRLLREAGGLGDIVRCLTVARGYKERYGADGVFISFWTLPHYASLVRLSPDLDELHLVPFLQRRPRDAFPDPKVYSYLRLRPGETPWDETVDLYCPAWTYERDVQGDVQRERTELWCAAAGVKPRIYRPELPVPAAATAFVDGWLFAHGLRRGAYLVVAPFSASPIRSWPAAHAAALSEDLLKLGLPLVIADDRPQRIQALGGVHAIGLPFAALMSLLSGARLTVTVDSGPLHLCGALGTPTLALFGMTSGPVICRHYPSVSPLSGAPADSCSPPCYGFALRGKDALLRCNKTRTCATLNAITPAEVLRRIGELL